MLMTPVLGTTNAPSLVVSFQNRVSSVFGVPIG
jgi:hypothetical protein